MDYFTDNNYNSSLDDLKDAAFEVLLLYPGSECADWSDTLIQLYPAEVVDALGNNPFDVFPALSDLWETPYSDPKSGVELTFSQWAVALCNEQAVDLYYQLSNIIENLR